VSDTRKQVQAMLGPEGLRDLRLLREKLGARLIGITDGRQTIGRMGKRSKAK